MQRCLKLSLPRHLYDTLGIQPNQPIIISKLKKSSKPDAHGDKVNTSNNSNEVSSDYGTLSRTNPEVNGESVDAEVSVASESLAITVDDGNGEQRIYTYKLNSITTISNSQSCGKITTGEHESMSTISKDLDTSRTNPHTESSDQSMPKHPIAEINDAHRQERSLSLLEKKVHSWTKNVEDTIDHEDSSSDTDNGDTITRDFPKNIANPRREYGNVVFPMKCHVCFRSYSCISSFSAHRKTCGKDLDKKHSFICRNCFRFFSSTNEFSSHLKICVMDLNEKGAYHCGKCSWDFSSPETYASHLEICAYYCRSCSRYYSNASVFSSHFQRCNRKLQCTNCDKTYSTKSSYSKHRKICEAIKRRLSQKISYPRTCPDCYLIYANKSSFCKHKKTCMRKTGKVYSAKPLARIWSSESVSESNTAPNSSSDLNATSETSDRDTWVKVNPLLTNSTRGSKYFIYKKSSSRRNC